MSDYTELCARLFDCYANYKWYLMHDEHGNLRVPIARDAVDAIEAQAREIEELRKTVHLAWNERDEVMRENDALRARAEAAEKDAARYRWLRKHCESASGLRFDWYITTDDGNWGDDAPSFDAAIDAARSHRPPASGSERGTGETPRYHGDCPVEDF